VYYACYGDGSPVNILEAGTDTGASQAYGRIFLEPLAERTTTCVYDRLGTGASDAPLEPARTLEDTRAVLEGLLAGTGWPAPYVLVGQSGGGNLHIDFAAQHPDEVARLVLIEAYHDDPEAMVAWQAEEGFEWTDNPEHVDVLDASIRLDELPLPFGDFPVVVITATHADEGNVRNQAYWLDISPEVVPRLVEVRWRSPA
jgi:pimeloyl-ACP methyl ester carboxylesterase